METVTPFKEVIEEIREAGGEATKYCYQCGKCDTTCPWNRVRSFSMRRLVREANFGLSEIEKDDIWLCTTCGKCPQRCPRDVRQIEDIVAVRRIATTYNVFSDTAKSIRTISSNLKQTGNPFGEDRSKRYSWSADLNLPEYTEHTDYLYSPCCYLNYDPRLKRTARATTKILKRFNIDFGIIGEKENCCGESIRKTGNEELFKRLSKDNIKNFIDSEVKNILVSSPHCYYTYKNEYSSYKVNFEVIHVVELLFQLLKKGLLKTEKEFPKKVVYHDPCYLGRHLGIYDEPREVLKSIKGLQLLTMEEEREDALCCGMGGGRVWMETHKEERFSNIRMKQALDAGAEVLVTACPYCITNFEDTRVVMNLEDKIEIMDITELVSELI